MSQAAQAMQRYSGWAPIEIDEAALNPTPFGGGETSQAQPSQGSHEQQTAQAQGAVPSDRGGQQSQQRPAPEPDTFVYDPSTGADIPTLR